MIDDDAAAAAAAACVIDVRREGSIKGRENSVPVPRRARCGQNPVPARALLPG